MPASKSADTLGSYGGQSGEARRADRRDQLLSAGLEIFGTTGYAGSSVKAICRQASLTERYFYESFEDKEDLLFAVYEVVANEVTLAALTAAEAAEPTFEARGRAGMGAFFHLLTSDIRKARVLSFEVVGVSERLERRRRETIHAFATYLARVGSELGKAAVSSSMDPLLAGLSMVGATNELLIEWVLGNIDASVDALVEHSTQMLVAVAHAAYGDDHS